MQFTGEMAGWSRLVATGIATAMVLVGTYRVRAEDWPQFRGRNCSGVSSTTKPLPIRFSSTENVAWSITLGKGVGSPVVAHGRVYATALVAPQKFAVFCFDAASGREIWTRKLDTGPLPAIMPPNEHASCTPATDGERVYLHFSTLGLIALNTTDGAVAWRVPLEVPVYLMGWGAANSPIVYNDLVLFSLDDDLTPYLVAVDKRTGEVRWRTERPEMLAGYAVPVLCTANGRTDVVIAGTGKMKGYDPETGKERWTCNTLLRTIMVTPVERDGIIYIGLQSYGDADRVLKYALLQWKDTNQDGKLSKTELPNGFRKKFDAGDADHDGFLVDDEIDKAFQSPNNMVGGGNVIQAIKGGGTGDVTKTHLLWSIENTSPSNIASPLLTEDRLFFVKKGGISSCFDAASGAAIWEKKRIRNFGNYYASPVAGDGKIYVTGENGFVVVLADGPKLKFLSKNDLGESCVASPAIADGRLYFRTLEKLYCIANRTAPATETKTP